MRNLCSSFFFFSCYGDHRDLHSFPTRRSSDLESRGVARRVQLRINGHQQLALLLRDAPAVVLDLQNLVVRSEEHTSELQSQFHLVCRLLLEKKKNTKRSTRLSINLTTSYLLAV